MTATAQQPDDRPQQTFVLPPPGDLLGNKVNTVLRIISTIQPMLCSQPVGDNWTDKEMEKVFEGGSCDAAQVTYIRACDRLDSILLDDENWKMKEMDDILHHGAREIAKTQLTTANLRHALMQDAARPCRRFPTKVSRSGGKFRVTFASKVSAGAVVGVGRTVPEAMDDFDQKFFRQQPEQPQA